MTLSACWSGRRERALHTLARRTGIRRRRIEGAEAFPAGLLEAVRAKLLAAYAGAVAWTSEAGALLRGGRNGRGGERCGGKRNCENADHGVSPDRFAKQSVSNFAG